MHEIPTIWGYKTDEQNWRKQRYLNTKKLKLLFISSIDYLTTVLSVGRQPTQGGCKTRA